VLDVSRIPAFVSVKAVGLSSNGKIQADDSDVCFIGQSEMYAYFVMRGADVCFYDLALTLLRLAGINISSTYLQ
jgi:hypothetical protein